uniref:D-aspartate oxidase-like n=1 Tax=Styela clava TaxID=7725 RepID=UPI001939A305|nr:D-aspartate oxidase-like [Styela clava]
MRSIAIVGAGVIGLSTAQVILEDFPDIHVTIYSSEFSPNTTGDISAGFVKPFFLGANVEEKDVIRWTKTTMDHLFTIAKEDSELSTGVSLLSGYSFFKDSPPFISNIIKECFIQPRLVSQEEIKNLVHGKYLGALFASTLTCACDVYLPYIMKKLKSKGVKFVQEKIFSLNTLAERGHDIVVNCCGFGAQELTGDQSLQPVRGQVIEVYAPWIKHFFNEEDGDVYVLPRIDNVIVGGTHTKETSLEVDKPTSKMIFERACKMIPSLKHGKIVAERVGLRPSRPTIRMEAETAITKSGKEYIVLHHYGHGGSGVTMHWGCAKQASDVLQKFLYKKSSKL